MINECVQCGKAYRQLLEQCMRCHEPLCDECGTAVTFHPDVKDVYTTIEGSVCKNCLTRLNQAVIH